MNGTWPTAKSRWAIELWNDAEMVALETGVSNNCRHIQTHWPSVKREASTQKRVFVWLI